MLASLGLGAALLSACFPLTHIAQVAAGNDFSCALHTDGTVTCWGNNDYGQLGDGTTTDHSWADQPVVLNR